MHTNFTVDIRFGPAKTAVGGSQLGQVHNGVVEALQLLGANYMRLAR
jgi:hypothetical protein